MSARLIQRIVELFIALIVLVALLVVVRDGLSLGDGGQATIRHPAQIAQPVDQAISGTASAAWSRGVVAVRGQPAAVAVNFIASLAGIAMLLVALLGVRMLMINFAAGVIFDEANITALRRIGFALLAACAISIGAALIVQPLLIAAINPPVGIAMHPALSWNVPGVTNIWLEYDVPVAMFVTGGIVLLFAQAFRAGLNFRRDSEGVL